MGDKDILSKSIFKNLVRDFATYLFGLPVVEVELLDTAQQRFEERRADLVARVSTAADAPFLLHIEIQNGNEAYMPARMLRYLSDILLAFPGLPARQYLSTSARNPSPWRMAWTCRGSATATISSTCTASTAAPCCNTILPMPGCCDPLRLQGLQPAGGRARHPHPLCRTAGWESFAFAGICQYAGHPGRQPRFEPEYP